MIITTYRLGIATITTPTLRYDELVQCYRVKYSTNNPTLILMRLILFTVACLRLTLYAIACLD